MISVIIPYIDQLDVLQQAVDALEANTLEYELVLIDNGSETPFEIEGPHIKHIHNGENRGVLNSFKQGFEESDSESQALVFVHSDVMIHEKGWDVRLVDTLHEHPDVGLLGFFGAQGTGSNGGRIRSVSNMQGLVWGKCDCHPVVGLHHGELDTGFRYAGGMDGLGMVFVPECLQQLIERTDAFDDWRAPHHFFDRILPCKVIDLGWKLGFLGIAFDHMSGATSCRSDIYRQSAIKWLTERGHPTTESPDHDIYLVAEQQFFDEFGDRLGVITDANGHCTWHI